MLFFYNKIFSAELTANAELAKGHCPSTLSQRRGSPHDTTTARFNMTRPFPNLYIATLCCAGFHVHASDTNDVYDRRQRSSFSYPLLFLLEQLNPSSHNALFSRPHDHRAATAIARNFYRLHDMTKEPVRSIRSFQYHGRGPRVSGKAQVVD